MIQDLIGQTSIEAQADVVVIGAGTAGLVIASELARLGHTVICLESGSWLQESEEHPLNEVVQTKSLYAGANHGRFRCLGGTSTRWGGALIPFLSSDIDDAQWPITYSEIIKYQSHVESLFNLPKGDYTQTNILTDNSVFISRLAKWPPFAKRNVFNLLSKYVTTTKNITIWINSTVTEFKISDNHLTTIKAYAPDKSSIQIKAKRYILTAGAIESTRLLLLLDQQNNHCITSISPLLGKNFHDHLSVVVGNLSLKQKKALNKIAGFRFDLGGSMRNLRFELADNSHGRQLCRPCFAHIGFEDPNPKGGFNALRDIFRYMQQRRIPPFNTLVQLTLSLPWLVRAVWWRFIEKRLLYPDNAIIQLHMVIEQEPTSTNKISLSNERFDIYNQPLAQIEWEVTSHDFNNLETATRLFQQVWNSSNLSAIATFTPRPSLEAQQDLSKGGGIYHPGGSTQIGKDSRSGVVNTNLELFSINNLSVVSTSVLPTGGGANPTMMLMMLAFRHIEYINKQLK